MDEEERADSDSSVFSKQMSVWVSNKSQVSDQ